MRPIHLLPFLLTLLGLLTTGCREGSFCRRGQGELETRSFDLGSIDGLSIDGNARVYLRQGDAQLVEVQTYPNVFEALETRVADGLLINHLDGCWDHTGLTCFITITKPLTQISLSGSGEVIGESLITAADQLDLDVSGSGEIELDLEALDITSDLSGSGKIRLMGTAHDQIVRVSGSGDYLAFDLIAEDCEVSVSGSGQVEVYLNGELDANVSGSGDIIYRGTPTSIDASVDGSGEVKKG